ncbi:ATP synthase subunit a [Manis javanica]|nr:ATP synthase subunit a [Manis javanica]
MSKNLFASFITPIIGNPIITIIIIFPTILFPTSELVTNHTLSIQQWFLQQTSKYNYAQPQRTNLNSNINITNHFYCFYKLIRSLTSFIYCHNPVINKSRHGYPLWAATVITGFQHKSI